MTMTRNTAWRSLLAAMAFTAAAGAASADTPQQLVEQIRSETARLKAVAASTGIVGGN